jgi:hypothetical protein
MSKGLKNAGESGLRNELNKRIKAAAKPLIGATQQAALRELPKRGGLAAQVAKTPQRLVVSTGKNPGVKIVVSKRAGVRSSNRGVIRKPLFGNRDHWYEQRIPGGWFDNTLDQNSFVIRKAIDGAVQSMFDEIAREARRGG